MSLPENSDVYDQEVEEVYNFAYRAYRSFQDNDHHFAACVTQREISASYS